MRFTRCLFAGLAAIAVAGCAGAPGGRDGEATPASKPASTAHGADQADASVLTHRAGARITATQFYDAYLAGRFTEAWGLLTAGAKLQVPRKVWAEVHAGCRSASRARKPVISSVTIFGASAIVTARAAGPKSGRTIRGVFSYSDGRWGYLPGDPAVYHHGSVRADVAAAKAAGLCDQVNVF